MHIPCTLHIITEISCLSNPILIYTISSIVIINYLIGCHISCKRGKPRPLGCAPLLTKSVQFYEKQDTTRMFLIVLTRIMSNKLRIVMTPPIHSHHNQHYTTQSWWYLPLLYVMLECKKFQQLTAAAKLSWMAWLTLLDPLEGYLKKNNNNNKQLIKLKGIQIPNCILTSIKVQVDFRCTLLHVGPLDWPELHKLQYWVIN